MRFQAAFERVQGADLNQADVIRVWWTPSLDTIVRLESYRHPMADTWTGGARIAHFASGVSMTVGNGEYFTRVHITNAEALSA